MNPLSLDFLDNQITKNYLAQQQRESIVIYYFISLLGSMSCISSFLLELIIPLGLKEYRYLIIALLVYFIMSYFVLKRYIGIINPFFACTNLSFSILIVILLTQNYPAHLLFCAGLCVALVQTCLLQGTKVLYNICYLLITFSALIIMNIVISKELNAVHLAMIYACSLYIIAYWRGEKSKRQEFIEKANLLYLKDSYSQILDMSIFGINYDATNKQLQCSFVNQHGRDNHGLNVHLEFIDFLKNCKITLRNRTKQQSGFPLMNNHLTLHQVLFDYFGSLQTSCLPKLPNVIDLKYKEKHFSLTIIQQFDRPSNQLILMFKHIEQMDENIKLGILSKKYQERNKLFNEIFRRNVIPSVNTIYNIKHRQLKMVLQSLHKAQNVYQNIQIDDQFSKLAVSSHQLINLSSMLLHLKQTIFNIYPAFKLNIINAVKQNVKSNVLLLTQLFNNLILFCLYDRHVKELTININPVVVPDFEEQNLACEIFKVEFDGVQISQADLKYVHHLSQSSQHRLKVSHNILNQIGAKSVFEVAKEQFSFYLILNMDAIDRQDFARVRQLLMMKPFIVEDFPKKIDYHFQEPDVDLSLQQTKGKQRHRSQVRAPINSIVF